MSEVAVGEQSPTNTLPDSWWRSDTLGLKFPEVGDWREFALCRKEGTDKWFAGLYERRTKTVIEAQKQAKEICKGCPVQIQCLRFAIKNDIQYGIWGGKSMTSMTTEQRTKLKDTFNK